MDTGSKLHLGRLSVWIQQEGETNRSGNLLVGITEIIYQLLFFFLF